MNYKRAVPILSLASDTSDKPADLLSPSDVTMNS